MDKSSFKNRIAQLFSSDDVVLLHSNCTRLFRGLKKTDKNIQLSDILDLLIEALPNGTLLLPTFNFDFCKIKTTDISHIQLFLCG